jgi:hypothetical protein
MRISPYEIAAAEKHPRNTINTKTRYCLLDEDAWTVESNPDMGVFWQNYLTF